MLEQQATRQPMRSESLIPFQIEQRVAVRKCAEWMRGLWFRPDSLLREAFISEMAGVYVPYWAFHADASSEWTAEAGYHYEETETYTERDAQGQEESKQRQVQKTRWESASGSRNDHYHDLLVCASVGLPGSLGGLLPPFQTKALRPYDPQYLVGWNAEEYAVDLDDAWKLAASQIRMSQEMRCGGDVPGDTHRDLKVDTRIDGERYKHVLLPIWVSAYRYRGKVYRFLVNGQTGELVGQAPPYSVVKVALFAIVMAAIVAAIAFIFWTRT